MMFPNNVPVRWHPAADPFAERLRPTVCVRRQILGGRFRFECDSVELLELAEAAYGGLPVHAFSTVAPEFRVEMHVVSRAPVPGRDIPPPIRSWGGAGVLSAMMDESNYVIVLPAQHRALVVISEDMLAYPYHVRYELMELAVFTLASRGLNLVPLHGACIGHEGRGVLLLGSSGAGKSTVALHGLLDGMEILAEDSVFVQPDSLLATGVANFLHVKQDALRFLDDTAVRDWITQSPVIHRRSGVAKFEADLRQTPGRPAAAPLRLIAAIFVSGETAHDPSRLLSRVAWEEVPARLAADQPYAAGQPGWDRFVHRLSGSGVYEMRRGTHPGEAVAALRGLLVTRDPGC